VSPGIVVLVTGGRDYTDRIEVHAALDDINIERKIVTLIHGACRVDALRQNWSDLSGADKLANEWALSRKVQVVTYPANFSLYGRIGGARRRDRDMFDLGQPDIVLAFPGNAGTRNCCAIAKARKILLLHGGESG